MRRTLLLLACAGCQGELLTGVDNLPGGNPLVPEVALCPFPSDFYLEADISILHDAVGARGPLAGPLRRLEVLLPNDEVLGALEAFRATQPQPVSPPGW